MRKRRSLRSMGVWPDVTCELDDGESGSQLETKDASRRAAAGLRNS